LSAPHLPPPPTSPDLHSFPTRRSSDLGQRRVKAMQSADAKSRSLATARACLADEVAASQDQRQALRLYGSHRGVAQTIQVGQHVDRKSTRLNSSHVKISYAVFCLKKKK